MSVSKVQRTRDVTAASIYAVYGTRRNMKRGEVRAELVTYEARGAETVLDFAQQVREDVHSAKAQRKNEALVLVQSWHPDVLNKNDEFDVDLAHSAGVELARGLVEHSDFMVATHLDGKSGHVHNHVVISNHDWVSGKTPREAGNWHRVKAVNDQVSRDLGLDQREREVLGHEVGRDSVSLSVAERMAQAQGRIISAEGLTLNELTGDTWRDYMRARIEELLQDGRLTDAPNVDGAIATMQDIAPDYGLRFRTDGGGKLTVADPKKAAKLPEASAFALIDDDGHELTYETAKRTRPMRTAGKKLGSDYSMKSIRQYLEGLTDPQRTLRRKPGGGGSGGGAAPAMPPIDELQQQAEETHHAGEHAAPQLAGGAAGGSAAPAGRDDSTARRIAFVLESSDRRITVDTTPVTRDKPGDDAEYGGPRPRRGDAGKQAPRGGGSPDVRGQGDRDDAQQAAAAERASGQRAVREQQLKQQRDRDADESSRRAEAKRAFLARLERETGDPSRDKDSGLELDF